MSRLKFLFIFRFLWIVIFWSPLYKFVRPPVLYLRLVWLNGFFKWRHEISFFQNQNRCKGVVDIFVSFLNMHLSSIFRDIIIYVEPEKSFSHNFLDFISGVRSTSSNAPDFNWIEICFRNSNEEESK